MKQLPLVKSLKNQNFYGGSLLHGRRKTSRPLCSKRTLHVVLKSQWATNQNRFNSRENKLPIEKILQETSHKYGIKIYSHAICGNHIHLNIRIKRRWLYRCFIAAITGVIAQHVMKKQSFKVFEEMKLKESRGEGVQKQEKGQAFWLHRPFSRIVSWGRDFRNCLKYLARNNLETLGFIEYKARPDYYAQWRIKLAVDQR